MAVTVGVNFLSVVHKDSGGVSIAFPDVCKVPAPPAPFAPVPFPNISKSADTDKPTKKVKADGNPFCLKDSNFKTSVGDEAGTLKGIACSKTKGNPNLLIFPSMSKSKEKTCPEPSTPCCTTTKTHRLCRYCNRRSSQYRPV